MNNNYLGISPNLGKKGNPIENISIKKMKDKLTKEYDKDYVNQTGEYNFLDEESESLFINDWISRGLDSGYIDLTQSDEVVDWIKDLIDKKIEVI